MSKKIAVIQTSFVSTEDLKNLFKEILPEVKMINIVDDSLLDEVKTNGHITPFIVKRICHYAQFAEEMGCDMILNQCSSVGEAVDIAQKTIHIPFIKIDQAMAEEAVRIGGNISVIATVASTLGPSCRLIERVAKDQFKKVNVIPCLVDGALDILMKEGNVQKHNQLVLERIEALEDESDVIVLAQGSMIVLLNQLSHIKKTILTSPRMGVQYLKEKLYENA